ncbi:MAG: hypothetical protein MUF04_10255 [Akkermansiaceae bacterium]|nr:hypothetical protein [Akkermansiaceae bacterium]
MVIRAKPSPAVAAADTEPPPGSFRDAFASTICHPSGTRMRSSFGSLARVSSVPLSVSPAQRSPVTSVMPWDT